MRVDGDIVQLIWYFCIAPYSQNCKTKLTRKIHTGIVLLAAGASSRMKKNKLLLEINGVILLENSILSAINSQANEVVLVHGANEKGNQKVVEEFDLITTLNPTWETGIGSSIKCGINKLMENSPNLDAIIISVCDQPFLTNEIFDGLINTYIRSGKKIITSAYSKSNGVPVLYDKSLFAELLKISDKQGAKKYVIEKASEDIIATFPFPKGEVDIDTLEDLKNVSLT